MSTGINTTEGGWTTVRKRGAPASASAFAGAGAGAGASAWGQRSAAFAAFGSAGASQSHQRPDRRREEQQMRAAVEFEKKAAKDAEDKRVASALNFKSATTYPSLGSSGSGSSGSGGSSAAAPPKATTLNFAGAAAAATATATAATAVAATITAAAAAPFSRPLVPLLHRRTIVTHCYDDVPEDYEGPDEGEMSDHESVPEGEGCDDWEASDTNDGQFNASLMESHRRSIW